YGKGNVVKTKSEITMTASIHNFNRGSTKYKSLAEGRIFPSIFRCLNAVYVPIFTDAVKVIRMLTNSSK
ncbi:MAG: hypothetical protein ACKPEQ_03230, partial [Dolichospermum sp.]